jgi:hypothetical protein
MDKKFYEAPEMEEVKFDGQLFMQTGSNVGDDDPGDGGNGDEFEF